MPGEYPNGTRFNQRCPSNRIHTSGDTGETHWPSGAGCDREPAREHHSPMARDQLASRRSGVLGRLFSLSVSASALLHLLPASNARAASLSEILDFGVFDPSSVFLLAVFGGAMSFALLSAFWLIRERARNVEENQALKTRFAGLRAQREKLEALLATTGQRYLTWSNAEDRPEVFGSMDTASGVPAETADFLAFGKWLESASAIELERAISELRDSAASFMMTINTRKGTALEVIGRTSGSHAHVCFVPVEGIQAELATARRENADLAARFDLVEALAGKLSAPFWMRNADGKLHWVNTAYANAVEAPDAETATREDMALFDRNEREMIERAKLDTGSFSGQIPAIMAGDRRMMETVVVSTGKGSAGIAIDRSEVDDVRATLKQAIASHQQTFDHLGTAIAIFDNRQRLQFYNSGFQMLWGFTSQQLEGEPTNAELFDILREEKRLPTTPDWKKWKQEQLSVYHATEAASHHWHLPDGRTLRVVANPQNHGGASWIFENLTEQLELKSNYNALVQVQGETLDHLNDAVAVFGSDGRIRLTNPVFLQLWGLDGGNGIDGTHVRDIARKCRNMLTEPSAFDAIEFAITGVEDGRDDLDGRFELSNGTVLDFHLVQLPHAQTMLSFTDMTAAVNVERALQDRNSALEESDALKTRFIQHVSYELRAPLTSIAGFTEVLRSAAPGRLNPKQEEYMGYIAQSSDVLKALIDDILDLATIDAGVMQLDLETVDVQNAITESLEAVADRIGQRHVRTEVSVERDAAKLIADPARLRQVIYNLLSNAAAASPDGGKILIEAHRQGGQIELSVSDQGPGISEEMSEIIFERFEGNRSNGNRRGAGLGLSVVRSFVELHGGSVRVENAGQRGARFVCSFPLEPAASRQAAE